MDPISLILSALIAGAAKPAGEVAHDAYTALKALIKRKFADKGKEDSAILLDSFEEKPDKTRPLLEDYLTEVGADKDKQIIELAHKLIEQAKSQETADAKSTIQISGGTVQGLIQHSHGPVTQNFNQIVKDDEPSNIQGRWIDQVAGNSAEIIQNGNTFESHTIGNLLGDRFVSTGIGSINGRDIDLDYNTRYQSGRQSRGNCAGKVSSDGTRLSSTCTDSLLGTFTQSYRRQ